MRLEPREATPLALEVLAPLMAILAALLLCALPIAWAGASPLKAYAGMAVGALGSHFALGETLARATPLLLTGLAATVAFRARLWNIGGEGQLYAGAIAAVMVGTAALPAPGWLMPPAVLLAGAAAGALVMGLATLMKLRLGADEVVTTLLMNFIMLLFVGLLLDGPLKDPMSMGWPQSEPVADAAMLPRLWARTRAHGGFILGLAACAAIAFILRRTVWGFEIQAVGANARAATFAGMPVGRILLRTGLISGALAGLAGASEVAGLKGYLTQDLSPGFGYAGIAVAMLAGLQPLAVIPAALLVAAIFVGADAMSRAVGISSFIADLIIATSLLTILLAGLVTRYRVVR